MPNPFPGMNPYLENPARWQGTHNLLISLMMIELNSLLPPHYAARVELRIYREEGDSGFKPDMVVTDIGNGNGFHGSSKSRVATIDAPVQSLVFEEHREAYLEILHLSDPPGEETLVTTIELLSPSNKRGGEGRDEYLEKQRRLLQSDTNFLEIDLLRAGQPTIAAQTLALRRKTASDDRQTYHCSLHRALGSRLDLWRFGVRDRFPVLPVPLLPEDDDVPLNLGALVSRFYADGRIDQQIRYAGEPIPPLSPEDATWTDELLRAAGRRE